MTPSTDPSLATQWLKKAAQDAHSIRAILTADGDPATACFLSHQLVEKSLKALTTHLDLPLKKTHDLLLLASDISAAIPTIKGQIAPLAQLNQYYIETRYRGDWPECSLSEAQAAQQMAMEINEFCTKQVSVFDKKSTDSDPG